MKTMHRLGMLLGTVLLLGAASLGVAACGGDEGGPPEVERLDETGRQLADQWMKLLQERDPARLDAFMSEAFLLQRADGSAATKVEYLRNLPEIRGYTIQDVVAKQDGPVLTVKWSLVVDQTIGGQTYKGDPAPRLSAFVWNGDKWCIVAHSNFNTPVATATPAR